MSMNPNQSQSEKCILSKVLRMKVVIGVLMFLTVVCIILYFIVFKANKPMLLYMPFHRDDTDTDKLFAMDNGTYNYDYKSRKAPRILCWIKTCPNNIKTRAKAIKETWGRHCDVTLFMSSKPDPFLPAIGLNTSEGRNFLTDKAMRAFQYVYLHHLDDADWFYACDDDTYAIIENLRHFVQEKDPNVPIYYGHKFKTLVRQGYSSGGSGYVLSHEALRRLGKFGYSPRLKCELVYGADDVEIGKCLEKLKVPLGDSRDPNGRSRFHCFDPVTHVMGRYPPWYYSYDAYGANKNFMSDYAISFHYITPDRMRELDYLIYHLRPFGSLKDKFLNSLARSQPRSASQRANTKTIPKRVTQIHKKTTESVKLINSN